MCELGVKDYLNRAQAVNSTIFRYHFLLFLVSKWILVSSVEFPVCVWDFSVYPLSSLCLVTSQEFLVSSPPEEPIQFGSIVHLPGIIKWVDALPSQWHSQTYSTWSSRDLALGVETCCLWQAQQMSFQVENYTHTWETYSYPPPVTITSDNSQVEADTPIWRSGVNNDPSLPVNATDGISVRECTAGEVACLVGWLFRGYVCEVGGIFSRDFRMKD